MKFTTSRILSPSLVTIGYRLFSSSTLTVSCSPSTENGFLLCYLGFFLFYFNLQQSCCSISQPVKSSPLSPEFPSDMSWKIILGCHIAFAVFTTEWCSCKLYPLFPPSGKILDVPPSRFCCLYIQETDGESCQGIRSAYSLLQISQDTLRSLLKYPSPSVTNCSYYSEACCIYPENPLQTHQKIDVASSGDSGYLRSFVAGIPFLRMPCGWC